jgi:hypothetical protein
VLVPIKLSVPAARHSDSVDSVNRCGCSRSDSAVTRRPRTVGACSRSGIWRCTAPAVGTARRPKSCIRCPGGQSHAVCPKQSAGKKMISRVTLTETARDDCEIMMHIPSRTVSGIHPHHCRQGVHRRLGLGHAYHLSMSVIDSVVACLDIKQTKHPQNLDRASSWQLQILE